jgi:hypothetical protein
MAQACKKTAELLQRGQPLLLSKLHLLLWAVVGLQQAARH